MARIIAVALPKGGTAKTSTVINLGAALVEAGQRVLVVDVDPQANLTLSLGVSPDEEQATIYHAIKKLLTSYEADLTSTIKPTKAGLDLVPASALLHLANDELSMALEREKVLKKLLATIAGEYDFCLLDTLPYLGILTLNALIAADEVLLPLQAEFLATKSTSLMLDQIDLLRRSGLNPTLRNAGVLLTMVDQRLLMSREAITYAKHVLGARAPIFTTLIRRSVRVPESQAHRETILQYDPDGPVAQAYRALAEEVLHGNKT